MCCTAIHAPAAERVSTERCPPVLHRLRAKHLEQVRPCRWVKHQDRITANLLARRSKPVGMQVITSVHRKYGRSIDEDAKANVHASALVEHTGGAVRGSTAHNQHRAGASIMAALGRRYRGSLRISP